MEKGMGSWMRRARVVVAAALVAALVACGGGGGGGTPLSGSGSGSGSGSSSGSGGSSTTTPTITVAIVDASGAAIASNSISSSAAYVRAVLRDAAGAVVASRLVTLSTDTAVATLAQATALTDASGVVLVRITPVSSTSAAAGTVTASAVISTTTVQATVDYQTSAASVVLSSLTPASTSITALQTSAVTVRSAIGSTAATAGQVSVNFSATCGTFSPTTASSASDGTVSTVYQSLATCSGPVTLTAQSGSSTTSASITVAPAQPANLLFSSTDQTTIFTSRASSGVKQATLQFRVVDSSGAGMASQNVSFSLSSTAVSAGVTFAPSGTSAAQTVTTNATGYAAVTVNAGSLPTPVIVTGTLVSNTSMQASSSTLAITSGVPTQNAASLAAAALSMEARNTDGVTNAITFRIADRQGNPVPAGTAVTFVASYGQVTGSCALNASSACTVTYTSQGVRPPDGRVAVLAYLDGEESFVDVNGNNSYDSGETFSDIGTAFRDDNFDGVRQTTEQIYPGGMVGTTACTNTATVLSPFVANTCDGIWSSSVRVRRQQLIILAGGVAQVDLFSARTTSSFEVLVSDGFNNSAATGSAVSAAIVGTSGCAVTSVSPDTVPNTTAPTRHTVLLNGDAACSTATVRVTVTSPAGVVGSGTFN